MIEFLIKYIFTITAALSSIATVLLFAKFIHKREPMILAATLVRLYVAGTSVIHAGSLATYPFLGLGLALVMLSDVISSLVYFSSRKFVVEIERATFLTTINHLLGKIATIIDNPYIGFFTVNESGTIEFANVKLSEMLRDRYLVGKNIFNYLDKETVDKMKDQESIHRSGFLMVPTPSGLIAKKVKITSATTMNGHRTISGSIIDYETITN